MNNPIVSYPHDENTPISHLPFSPAVRVGDLIFISGQASVDKTGKIIPGTFEEEFRRSVENLRDALEGPASRPHHHLRLPARDAPLRNGLRRRPQGRLSGHPINAWHVTTTQCPPALR